MSAATSIASPAVNRPFRLTRLFGSAAAAAALNVIIYIASSAAGVSMAMGAPVGVAVGLVQVIAMSVVPILLAGFILFQLCRFRPGLRAVARWAGLAFGVLSMAGPISLAGDVSTAATLAPMHLVVGVAWALALRPGASSGDAAAGLGR